MSSSFDSDIRREIRKEIKKRRTKLKDLFRKTRFAKEVQGKPFWIEDEVEHVRLQILTGDKCCFCHIIGLPEKEHLVGRGPDGREILERRKHPIFDYEMEAYHKLFDERYLRIKKSTELGKHYDIYEEDGEMVGQQYPTETGPIDILAISKDKKTLLVVELKRGRVSDVVVGQCQRYMGYIKQELVEDNQEVRGVIIASEDDKKIQLALVVAPNIDFFTYITHFRLEKKH